MRDIPPKVFRFWAECFEEGKLYDDYSEELAHFLRSAANHVEFNDQLEKLYNGGQLSKEYH